MRRGESRRRFCSSQDCERTEPLFADLDSVLQSVDVFRLDTQIGTGRKTLGKGPCKPKRPRGDAGNERAKIE
jgi:hypothetical protein